MLEQRIKREKRKKRKALLSRIFGIAAVLILAAMLLLRLNDRYLHIGAIPSTYDVIRFFGGGAKPYVKLSEGETAVSFIDVGQGDCELITANGYNILIDSGDVDMIDGVIGFLRYGGVERLDLVIITHPHEDHYGGMYKLLGEFEVGEVLMPELEADGSTYEKLMRTVSERGIRLRYAAAGERFLLGGDTYLDILAPICFDYGEENNFSVVARFVCGETSFLFMGDLERAGELDLIDAGYDLSADVLKVGHHGSAGSSCGEFLRAVSPSIAVFEAGKINYYGHPRGEVLERLAAAGCEEAYSTAGNGNIVIVSDGGELRVLTEREGAYRFTGE